MNTKTVCEKLSVTPKMLRVYEEQGLIKPKRLENNYRDYSVEKLVQIETIAILRRLGFSVNEIKSILAFDRTNNEYLDMFYLQYKALESQITELMEIKRELKGTINKMIENRDGESLDKIILTGRENRNNKLINYDDIIDSWNFDEMASDFINRYMKEDIPYQRTIRKLQDMIKTMDDKTFTDVGCGTCNLWEESGEGTDVLAIDKSLHMLLESKKKFPWVKVAMDDILSPDMKLYRKSDVVVSAFMLHHIEYPDQFKAIDNILGLCRDGGTVLIADRCYQDSSLKGADPTEFFIIAEEVEEYLRLKRTDVYAEFTDDNMVIFRAERR